MVVAERELIWRLRPLFYAMDRRRSMDNRVRKRKPEDDLNNERLAKRLESLKLGVYVSYVIRRKTN